MADSVQLTDLDVIARYSIAVRAATADRDDLIDTLRADLAWLERDRGRGRPAREVAVEDVYDAEADEVDYVEDEPAPRAPIRRMPVRVTPRPAAARKTAAVKKTAAKKTATRRTSR